MTTTERGAMTKTQSDQPLYRANVDVEWPEGGRLMTLGPGDKPAPIPPKIAAWLVRCGAVEEVK